MNRRTIILTSVISVFLIVVCTLVGTYSVVINVTSEEGVDKIINEITIRDLVTSEDGKFNNIYYDVKRELNINDYEADLLIDSISLNDSLKSILNTIVDYRLHNNMGARLSNDELYNIIVNAVNNTNTINQVLKDKVINKANLYKQDISDFVYDIEVSRVG